MEMNIYNKRSSIDSTLYALHFQAHIAAKLVERIRTMDPPGRFLKEDSDTGMWCKFSQRSYHSFVFLLSLFFAQCIYRFFHTGDIGDAKAIKKVGQALREDAPEIRPEIDNGTGEETKKSDDDGNDDEEADVKRTNSKDKGSSSPSSNRVIVLPTSRSGRRGEDDSPGALPPQAKSSASVSSGGSNGYQQVLPPQGSMPPPQSQRGVMYPPSSSSSASTLRHGQFSYGRNQGGAMSRQAMEMMNQQQMYNQAVMNNVLFGRPFHPPPSEMSFGSHGSSVSGMSGLTNSALMSGISDGVSSLTAGSGGARFSQGQMDQATYNNQMMHAAASNRLMNSMNPRPVGMFQHQNSGRSGSSVYSGSRGSNGGAGFNNYMTAGSDVSGQTMPQAAAVLGRTASHGDGSGAVKEDLSLAENSLRGGGIRGDASYQQQQYQQQFMQQQRPQQADDGSIASGHSGESRTRPCAPGFKDSMDYSVYSGTSIPSRSARGGPSYASRYGSTNASVSNRSYTSNYSIGAMSQSVADMSLQSGASVASFSA